MRTVTALDVRRRFGQIIDEAAAGERIVIERAGQPVAALVPLADLALIDPDRRRAARLAALDDIQQLAHRRPFPPGFDPVATLREQRRIIVVADATKLGRVAFARICPIDRVDILVTDGGAPADAVASLTDAGVEVRLA